MKCFMQMLCGEIKSIFALSTKMIISQWFCVNNSFGQNKTVSVISESKTELTISFKESFLQSKWKWFLMADNLITVKSK